MTGKGSSDAGRRLVGLCFSQQVPRNKQTKATKERWGSVKERRGEDDDGGDGPDGEDGDGQQRNRAADSKEG